MRVFLSALVFMGVCAGASSAQQADDRFSVLSCGLLYLDDAAFRKEVALSPQQITSLTAEREKLMTAYGKLTLFGVFQQAGKLCAAADKAVSAILAEKQATRWRQLVLQDYTRRFGAYRTVRMPEVTAALSLSDEQVQRLEKGDDIADVLDMAQQQKWRQLRGEAMNHPVTLTLPPPLVVSWPTPLESAHLHALAMPSVQEELKISDEQGKKLEGLRQQWIRGRQEIRAAAPERQPDLGKTLLAKIDKGIGEVLSKEQKTRLYEIANQFRLPRRVPLRVAIFLDESTRKSLELTSDQVSRMDKILEERRTLLRKAAESSDSVGDFVKALDSANEQIAKEFDGVLDKAQNGRISERFGKPFTGPRVPVEPDSFHPDPAFASPVPVLLRVLPYLQQEGLSAELHISDAQKKDLAALDQTLADDVVRATDAPTSREREAKRQEVYNSALKSMQKILSTEQQTRLRELLVQYLETVPGGRPEFRIQALAHWPEMIKELGLSEAQLATLDDALHIKQVLTADQWKKWQQLRGKPSPLLQSLVVEELAVPLPARLNYLEEPTVLDELKLSGEQRKKLAAGLERWRELALRSAIWTPAERKEKFPALKKQIHDELFALLTREQAARLSQIGRQQWLKEEGLSGLFEIVDTESELKLTAEQKPAVNELRQDRDLIDRLIRQQRLQWATIDNELEFWDGSTGLIARLEKLLTEDQRKRLTDLLGKPFEAALTPHALKSQGVEDQETRLFGFAPPR